MTAVGHAPQQAGHDFCASIPPDQTGFIGSQGPGNSSTPGDRVIALDANKTMEKFDVDGNQAPKLNSRTNNKEQPKESYWLQLRPITSPIPAPSWD